MKNVLTVGLISGTSFDGIDAALVKFSGGINPEFIDGIVYKYPAVVKEKIRNLINADGVITLQEISQLNFLIGEVFAEAANQIIKKNKLKPTDILLIGSHGQTIFHHPKPELFGKYKINSTLQIGESSVIAFRTGIKTISNFREADIAAGGTGAPLVPYLDYIIFGESKAPKAVLNIGGISNVTIVGKSIVPIAFDIGPGNALIDLIAKSYLKKNFDKDGLVARKGKIFYKLIYKALTDEYFNIKPPKSTGKEYFNLQFIKKYFSTIRKKEDLIATLTFFTAKIIEKGLRDFVFKKYKIKELVISGGGIKNKTLLRHMEDLLPGILVTSSDKYGLPYKYKEAILFALLGYTNYLKETNNIPSCTGAKKKVILGKMTIIV